MRILAFVAMAVLAPIAPPAQAHDTPEALIAAIYEPYIAGDIPSGEEELWSENLLALYEADRARTPDGEMGALDFDPFVNGQDFEITKLEIIDAQIEADYSVVEVTFENFGEPRNLLYSLVKEADGWKVDDVQSLLEGSEYRLTDILLAADAN